jgi:hypothetical protein
MTIRVRTESGSADKPAHTVVQALRADADM